ncbi:MAG: alpha/beta fold hydrolase [Verrucomicrobiaceae bacterium]|nr:alpha/beta fold hydrolase [Verrucomicrobiaceae bacterium]
MTAANTSAEIVVMLHGLARTPRSMLGAGLWFKKAGYRVAYVSYPSRKMGVEDAVRDFVAPALQKIAARPGVEKVHFVTHSLGGIVFRAWAASHAEKLPVGRAVLLAPPNNGSEIADKLGDWIVAKKIMGPVLQELRTDENAMPKRLGAVKVETGVIMGDEANLPFFRQWLDGASDGVVTVEGGRIGGLKDFLVLPAGHSWIMWRPKVLEAAVRFIREGSFGDGRRD